MNELIIARCKADFEKLDMLKETIESCDEVIDSLKKIIENFSKKC